MEEQIQILGKMMPIKLIVGWEVSIRSCEFRNLTRLIRGQKISTSLDEQRAICSYLTLTGYNLTEIVTFPQYAFETVKQTISSRVKRTVFWQDLEKCRCIILSNAPGCNLLRYLLYRMNNLLIRDQLGDFPNNLLSGLYAKNQSKPFDNTPFTFNLAEHRTNIRDVFICIGASGREHELFAKYIQDNTENKGQLFTPLQELHDAGFQNIEFLAQKYNSVLWYGHRYRKGIKIEHGFAYVNQYVIDTKDILNELKKYASDGVSNYSDIAKQWIDQPCSGVDCDEKAAIIERLFSESKVAILYGAAGTGKSKVIEHIANLYSEQKLLFLAYTNSAVENLKRRIPQAHSSCFTITIFLNSMPLNQRYDLVVIDECSTVSNEKMAELLLKVSAEQILLAGDTYQIASIQFGNWFFVARYFLPKTAVYELKRPYRAQNDGLLTLWDRVRNMEHNILEGDIHQKYSIALDSSVFDRICTDEIVLCLNYDGLYGINNINHFLQEINPNQAINWGIHRYKVNDPVLFNDSNRFMPVIYNIMKGRIVAIGILDKGTIYERIYFDIVLEYEIDQSMLFWAQGLQYIGTTSDGKSIIRFCVNKVKNQDEDEEDKATVMPLQVAYAVSIHKAQGLEYPAVKVIITDEVDEFITHNIFYTSTTRARERLKIYWTAEVENRVLSRIKPIDRRRDVALLKNYIL